MSGLLEEVLSRLFPALPDEIGGLRARLGRRVTARGRVVPRDLIASPLTNVSCVYYSYVVEEWRRADALGLGAGGSWHAVDHDEAIAEFAIDDGTGRALILPERAEVLVARGEAVDVPAGQRASETRLMAGDLVEVRGLCGEVTDLLDESRGYREPPARVVVRAPEGQRLKIRLLGSGS